MPQSCRTSPVVCNNFIRKLFSKFTQVLKFFVSTSLSLSTPGQQIKLLANDFSFTILNILSDGRGKFGFNALKYSSSFLNEKVLKDNLYLMTAGKFCTSNLILMLLAYFSRWNSAFCYLLLHPCVLEKKIRYSAVNDTNLPKEL